MIDGFAHDWSWSQVLPGGGGGGGGPVIGTEEQQVSQYSTFVFLEEPADITKVGQYSTFVFLEEPDDITKVGQYSTFVFLEEPVTNYDFAATNDADQTSVSSNTPIEFDTEHYDLGGRFASTTYTVPDDAGAGVIMDFAAGLIGNGGSGLTNFEAQIQIQRGGVGSFSRICGQNTSTYDYPNLSTGPVIVYPGDVLRVAHEGNTTTVANYDYVFFSGRVCRGGIAGRAYGSDVQDIPADELTQLAIAETSLQGFDLDENDNFVVPPQFDGRDIQITAGARYVDTDVNPALNLYIQQSVDDGANWINISQSSSHRDGSITTTRPVASVSEGDLFRAAMFCDGGDVGEKFLAVELLADDAEVVTNDATGTQAIPSSTVTALTNVAQIEVTAGQDGKYIRLFAGVRYDAAENSIIYIQKSTDDGASWVSQARASGDRTGNAVVTRPILAVEGDLYRVSIFANSAQSVQDDARTFLGAIIEDQA